MNAARTSGPVVFACLWLLGVLAAQAPSSAPTPVASNPQPVYPRSAIQDAAIGRVETRLNGVLVSAIADRRFTGLIGFEVSAGTLEVRGAEIVRRDTFLGGDFSIAAERPKGPGGPVPKLVREVKPVYSPQAMRDVRQGEVFLDAIVDATGKLLEPRISRSLDIDLDQAAVAALRQWQFEPAMRDGRPVATVIQVQMAFALR